VNFDFSEKQRSISKKIKGLLDTESQAFLAELQSANTSHIRNALLYWLEKLRETDYLTLGLDGGKNSVDLVTIQESLATVSPSLFLSIEISTRIFGRLVSVYGNPDLKAEILPGLKQGRFIGAVGLTEDCTSIENNPFATKGVQKFDAYQLSGEKGHVVNAPVADQIAIAARTDGGIAFFLIRTGSDGLTIGPKMPTLGFSGATAASVTMFNCPAPLRSIVGPFVEHGLLKTVRCWEDQILTAASLGLMRRCFDVASNYAKRHTSGGRPIIGYQEISFKLAEMLTVFQTSQLLAYRAAWMDETGDREASVMTHCAKVFCSESAEEVATKALQVLGMEGYLRGNFAEEGFRDAKYLQIAGTSSEISRMKIADGLLE
jgi:alkylation response protein AidB-like acyl-CoA dehydrogenase